MTHKRIFVVNTGSGFQESKKKVVVMGNNLLNKLL